MKGLWIILGFICLAGVGENYVSSIPSIIFFGLALYCQIKEDDASSKESA